MIAASCHCGAVRLELDELPAQVTDCNCSICRRVSGLWGYYDKAQVRIEGVTVGYVHGDRTLALHHCNVCGCTTHWESLDPANLDRMGVNMRMADPVVMAEVKIRKFDGADTWTYLDEDGGAGG